MVSISDQESGASVRSKLNAMFSNVETILLSDSGVYETLAEFVADAPTPDVGTVTFAAGIAYFYDGVSAVAGLPAGWVLTDAEFASVDVDGNITLTGTVDGRDVAADGTKLDGIEAAATADQTAGEIKTAYESNADTNAFTDADESKLDGIETGADVTDTTNVTAAGALMDSEVTNLAQVKAFDASDYATAAQGALADSAQQPLSEGAFVDGDKTKLDGIESLATADQTGAEIKALYEGEADTNAFDDAAQSKLAGIESGADVTDATNVTAAGALMDSEVTNLAQVKAFDASDYATAAQGTLADSAVQPGDDANALGSGAAIDGKVLTSDGAGNVAWEDVPTAGSAISLSDVATDRIIGRVSAGSGDSEELTATQVRTLINVEDGADVTDTTNVTAAGALMDSELTDIAAVKALDQGVATTDTVSFTAVGVGIASPSEELHVAASGGSGAAVLFTNGNTGSTATDGLFVGYSNAAYVYNYENTDLIFATNDTTRMTLKADGDLGIGTSSPADALDVVGNIHASGEVRASGEVDVDSVSSVSRVRLTQSANDSYSWAIQGSLADESFKLENAAGNKALSVSGFTNASAVKLYSSDVERLATTSSGVDITGELAATSAVTTATAPVAGVYATYAAAEAATIPAAVTSLKVRRGGDIIEYVRDATGTALTTAGSINWSPVKVDGAYPVVAWNPPVDGVTNDSTAVQAAFDWCVAEGEPFALHFMPGSWTFTSGVDCTAATEAFEMRGHREMVNMVATGYGADSYMFDIPGSVKSTWSGFTFGTGSGALKNHPIALNIREGGRTTIRDITGAAHGNTILFSTRPFNADWDSLDLFFCGWQPLHKDVDASTITLSDDGSFADRVTASAAVFASGDVGKDIYVYHDTSANEATVYRITAYNSTTSVTLDRDRDKTLSAAKFSFDQIRAVVTGTTVVFDRDIGMEAADVGRMIYIDRAGADGQTHVDQIASVTAGDEIELENAVTTNGTYRIFFTPSVYIGSHDIVGTGPNDICIDRMLIEGFAGPALMIDGGLHIKIGEMKTHGRAWGDFSNFGQSAEALIWNAAHKSRIENWEMEFCGHMQDSATVRVAGDAPGLSIGYLSHNAPLVGGYLFDVEFTDTEKSYLGLPDINGRSNLDLYDGILLSSSNSVARRVNFQRIGGASRAIESSRQGPQMIGSVRSLSPWSLANGASVTFTTPTIAGVVSVTANDTPNYAGVFSFYTNGCALLAGSNASATLTTASSLNVDCSSGELTIENNTGATRRFHVGMLG